MSSVKTFLENASVKSTHGDSFHFSTPMGQNMIPTATLTKGQKIFSTNDSNPNLPKPKTLYFVHFNLNEDLDKMITQKRTLIENLVGGVEKDGSKALFGDALSSIKNISAVNDIMKKTSNFFGAFDSNDEKKQTDKSKLISDSMNSSQTLTDYIPTKDVLKKLSFELSKLVKSYDKPNVSFKISEFNEYNRKRLIYSGVDYNDVKITFYDVKENPVQQFFTTYLKFICGDFLCKDKYLWEAPINNRVWQNKNGYKTVEGVGVGGMTLGNMNSFGLNIDSNFKLINSISFCEYYMDKLMVYTIENPIIKSIQWGDSVMGDFNYNDITITFSYEGITNDLLDIDPYDTGETWNNKVGNDIAYTRNMINKEIKHDVAQFLQTKYQTITSSFVSDITSILKAYMNGDVKFSWNTIKNQTLDMMRKYDMANEANTIAQLEQTINNYNSKDGDDKWKYLINMTTDSTSLIGKTVSGSLKSGTGIDF